MTKNYAQEIKYFIQLQHVCWSRQRKVDVVSYSRHFKVGQLAFCSNSLGEFTK